MYQSPEQFMQLGKSSIEAALSVANITLQGAERLVGLQLKTAKAALDEGMRSARALSDVKSVQELIALQSTTAQPGIEKALAYSRSLYEVASETQSQINKVLEDRMAKVSGEFVAAMDKAVKNAPAGSETAFAAFRSAVAAANTAYEAMSKVARDAADVAVSNTAAHAAKAAKKRAH
ncbi:MAG: phasin family protein [Betaproteobacteria bacterium]|nr:MAG: phasin family protein [Betaproteobacteria bacterium]